MEYSRPQLNYKEALSKAAEICGRSEKCSYDIVMKCHEWQLSKEDTDRITKYLTQEKYLDDQRYAISFVHDKFRFNKWGRIKLAYALRQKQIVEKFIREALTHISEDAYRTVLTDLLSAKAKTIKENDVYTRRSKLMAFALSRGFEAEEIRKCVNQI